MSAHTALSDTFHLSARLAVEIAVSRIGIVCEWTPAVPERMTAAELTAYRCARDTMLTRLATQSGVILWLLSNHPKPSNEF